MIESVTLEGQKASSGGCTPAKVEKSVKVGQRGVLNNKRAKPGEVLQCRFSPMSDH